MSLRFPKTSEFTGSLYAPSRFEGQIRDLEVEGQVPLDLRGSFVQVAPDPEYPPMLGDDIYFNGDGAVSAFRFIQGHVDFQRRYVDTARLLAQRKARRSLHGVYRNPFTNDPSVAGLSNSTANTNIVPFNGMLLALKEDSLPYAMDANSLETLGEWNFRDQITNTPFTAHPKIDPVSGALIAFGYEAKGIASRDIVCYEFDRHGIKTREVWIEAPYAGMIHDFAVTPNFVIFPLLPSTADLDRIRGGGRHFEWQPELDFRFGVLSRRAEAGDVRWFSAPNCFQAHVLNAYEEADGKIVLDMPMASGNIFYFFPQADGRTEQPETLKSELARWTLDPHASSDRAQVKTLFPWPCEFPRCDYRYVGQRHQHAFMLVMDPRLPYAEERIGPRPFQFFNQIAHLDLGSGHVDAWFSGDTDCFQEPTFVARSADSPEGDGYLIALLNHLAEGTTELIVMDTLRVQDGPVARIKLPLRLRMSIHGNWVSDPHADGLGVTSASD
jgi:carotenoid cleavage dioxygenase-like enzyme